MDSRELEMLKNNIYLAVVVVGTHLVIEVDTLRNFSGNTPTHVFDKKLLAIFSSSI